MNKVIADKSSTYKVSRYFTPSSITASQTTKNKEVWAGRKLMSTPLTYCHLIEQNGLKVQLENLNAQTAANRVTALRGFLAANGMIEEDVVGDEMRMRSPEAVERFVNRMQQEGRSARNISNTISALRRWKEAVVEYDTLQALKNGNLTPFQQAVRSLFETESTPVLRVAKSAGIPKDMLWGWIRGKIPRGSSARYLHRLEIFFGLERNSLINISGMRPVGFREHVGGDPAPIEYNQKIGELTKDGYCIKPAENSPLRQQWEEFVRYKTAAVPHYRRTKRGQWRFSPCPLTPNTTNNWWSFLDGREVASARVAWAKISSYLGWLALPIEEGGKGFRPAMTGTLAWLAVPDYLQEFFDWQQKRLGKRNQSVNQFLALIAALVRPRFGYLRQRPEVQATLPDTYRTMDWEMLCERQFELTEQLVSAYRNEIEVSRDSFEPIRHIIELQQPMDAVADMVQRMRADRPVGQPRHECVWARDMVLIKLLISNPLRRRNLAHLTWRADNNGELYQRSDNSWWLRIAKTKFKNRHGAAGENIYDCQVHPSAWRDIERYLHIYRPQLLREPTDLLFLTLESPRTIGHRPWRELSQRVAQLTTKYLVRCRGIGSHAFRHLVATSILKADGGDYKTAALVLNDRVATVEKHYAGLRSNDGADRMAALLASQFNRM